MQRSRAAKKRRARNIAIGIAALAVAGLALVAGVMLVWLGSGEPGGPADVLGSYGPAVAHDRPVLDPVAVVAVRPAKSDAERSGEGGLDDAGVGGRVARSVLSHRAPDLACGGRPRRDAAFVPHLPLRGSARLFNHASQSSDRVSVTIGWCTVTSFVPSGNVPSTCTSRCTGAPTGRRVASR